MASGSLLAVTIKGGVAATGLLIAALGLAAVLTMAVALFRNAADAGEARSRGDVPSRLRALDELASQGLLKPDDYASRRAELLLEN